MKTRILNYIRNEDGAVTVDWVVLTAAIVGLGIAVLALIGDGTMSLADRLGLLLSLIPVPTYG